MCSESIILVKKNMDNQPIYKNTKFWLLISITLGLAPFFPEPHIWGKLQWIFGGGAFHGENKMMFMDWFDVFLHGTPWAMFVYSLLLKLKK